MYHGGYSLWLVVVRGGRRRTRWWWRRRFAVLEAELLLWVDSAVRTGGRHALVEARCTGAGEAFRLRLVGTLDVKPARIAGASALVRRVRAVRRRLYAPVWPFGTRALSVVAGVERTLEPYLHHVRLHLVPDAPGLRVTVRPQTVDPTVVGHRPGLLVVPSLRYVHDVPSLPA